MLQFYFKRNFKDLFAHFILIVLPVVLILILHYVNMNNAGLSVEDNEYQYFTLFLTFGFIYTFQIYGSSISFERLAVDLFTGISNRLKMAPINLYSIVIVNLLTSIIENVIQSVLVFMTAILFLGLSVSNPLLLLLLILVSVCFNQILFVFVLLISKSIKFTTVLSTAYGILAPLVIGLYFQLPQDEWIQNIKSYGTPAGIMMKMTTDILTGNYDFIRLGFLLLISSTILLFLSYKPLLRRSVDDL